jgi:hypothetical protein
MKVNRQFLYKARRNEINGTYSTYSTRGKPKENRQLLLRRNVKVKHSLYRPGVAQRVPGS